MSAWTVTWTGELAAMAKRDLFAAGAEPFRCGRAGAIWTCTSFGCSVNPDEPRDPANRVTATLQPVAAHDIAPASLVFEVVAPTEVVWRPNLTEETTA